MCRKYFCYYGVKNGDLHKPIETSGDNAIQIVQCICFLYNIVIYSYKEGHPFALQTLKSK